jgi:hypothetical protein
MEQKKRQRAAISGKKEGDQKSQEEKSLKKT